MFNSNEKKYHIGLSPAQGAKFAIVTGDPGRTEFVAKFLDNPVFVASNREYVTWAGEICGERVLVTSHGIGGPSTAICIEELSFCGVRTIVRVGTCGGMSIDVQGGNLVVAQAAIKQEGTSREYLPAEYPAVADFFITKALYDAAHSLGKRTHVGVVHCKDSFYGQHSPETSPVSQQLLAKWDVWLKAGCLASEMETAALFSVATARKIRAGCILNVLWNQERRKAGLQDSESEGMDTAVLAAVNAMKIIIGK